MTLTVVTGVLVKGFGVVVVVVNLKPLTTILLISKSKPPTDVSRYGFCLEDSKSRYVKKTGPICTAVRRIDGIGDSGNIVH
jgi:hypothetical protein